MPEPAGDLDPSHPQAKGSALASHNTSPLSRYDPAHAFHDLSPTATLRALVANSDLSSDTPVDEKKLVGSVEKSSVDERAFAQKVAETSRLLKEWCRELGSWEWNRDFEAPSELNGHDAQHGFALNHSPRPAASVDSFGFTSEEHSGPLLAERVLYHETRLEQLRDYLNEIDLEDQRYQILELRGRNASTDITESRNLGSAEQAVPQLDNMHALITTTIVQALPKFSELAHLMNTWSSRLSVLRQTPSFRRELGEAQKVLDAAWMAIGIRRDAVSGMRRARTVKVGSRGLFRESFNNIRDDLEGKVANVGQRVDGMLDLLEGLAQMLPDHWIDAVDGLEIDYSSWTIEAQKKVLLYESRFDLLDHRPRNLDSKGSSFVTNSTSEPKRRKMPGAWYDIGSESTEHEDEINQHQEQPVLAIDSRHTCSNLGIPDTQSTQGHAAQGELHSDELDRAAITRQHISRHTTVPLLRRSLQARGSHGFAPIPVPRADLDCRTTRSLLTSSTYKRFEKAPALSSQGPHPYRASAPSSDAAAKDHEPHRPSKTSRSTRSLHGQRPTRLDLNSRQQPSPLIDSATGMLSRSHLLEPSSANLDIHPRSPSPYRSAFSKDEQLEKHIESILTTVPLQVRFDKSYSTHATSADTRTPIPSLSTISESSHEIHEGEGAPPLFTIVPAFQKENRTSALGNNSDIKLFYLYQRHSDEVIKLFLRVGGIAGSQALLRVRGGWCDLGEYLREYVRGVTGTSSLTPRTPRFMPVSPTYSTTSGHSAASETRLLPLPQVLRRTRSAELPSSQHNQLAQQQSSKCFHPEADRKLGSRIRTDIDFDGDLPMVRTLSEANSPVAETFASNMRKSRSSTPIDKQTSTSMPRPQQSTSAPYNPPAQSSPKVPPIRSFTKPGKTVKRTSVQSSVSSSSSQPCHRDSSASSSLYQSPSNGGDFDQEARQSNVPCHPGGKSLSREHESWIFGKEIVDELAGRSATKSLDSRLSDGNYKRQSVFGVVGSASSRGRAELMTPDKQMWIEEMMQRARTVWREHGPGSRVETRAFPVEDGYGEVKRGQGRVDSGIASGSGLESLASGASDPG